MYLYMYLYPFITSFWLFLEIFSDPSLFFYRGLLIFLSDKFGFLSLYYILLYTILVLFDIWLPFDLYITSPACTSHYYVDGHLSLNLFFTTVLPMFKVYVVLYCFLLFSEFCQWFFNRNIHFNCLCVSELHTVTLGPSFHSQCPL